MAVHTRDPAPRRAFSPLRSKGARIAFGLSSIVALAVWVARLDLRPVAR